MYTHVHTLYIHRLGTAYMKMWCTFLHVSVAKVIDGGQEGPQPISLLFCDLQNLQTVLNQLPHIGSTLNTLLLERRRERGREGVEGGREGEGR